VIEKFYSAKVLVIGDVMLDKYLYGQVERISPEAPVPVVLVSKESYVPGGAGNVANNIVSLKANCRLIGLVGNDENAGVLKKLLSSNGIEYNLLEWDMPTITKTRVVSGNQQLIRLDFEKSSEISENLKEKLKEQIAKWIETSSIVVISDYGKNICSYETCQFTIKQASKLKKSVIVDPKKTDWQRYRGATVITPNLKELGDFYGRRLENDNKVIESVAKKIYPQLGISYLVVTRSEKGMTVYDGKEFYHFPTEAKEVYDVSGAGDTVVATLSVALASGFDIKEAALLANKAAGIVVGKAGTSPVYYHELLKEIENESFTKLVSLDELLVILDDLRKKNKKIVFTNGCFDIIHRGHVTYLREAKKLGDVLIIGLNSDESVKRLKGNARPINSVEDRANVLSALEVVDYVVVFEEDTPYELLSKVRPDILVKGGDYKEEEVVGREFAHQTVILPFVAGYSTTNIIQKIGGLS
jgi:D-beta-D-heptose 7-phosphate kinase/D-beta-D-heptose 1-phosphate adenosyltransferase